MKVLAVCGMPGSGKGEIAGVARGKGIKVHSMGDVVREFFARECPERDPIETGMYADMERKKHGKDIWARRLVETLERELTPETDLVMIDGLRSKMESDLFRSRWGRQFLVLAVHSSPDKRFNRLSRRGRGDDSTDRNKFDERDDRELGWGLGEVISRAEIMIVNGSRIETFKQQVNNLLDHLEEEEK